MNRLNRPTFEALGTSAENPATIKFDADFVGGFDKVSAPGHIVESALLAPAIRENGVTGEHACLTIGYQTRFCAFAWDYQVLSHSFDFIVNLAAGFSPSSIRSIREIPMVVGTNFPFRSRTVFKHIFKYCVCICLLNGMHGIKNCLFMLNADRHADGLC